MIPQLLVTALATLTGQVPLAWPPDMSDLFRGADQRPEVDLVLDISCSMSWGAIATPCTWYANTRGRNDGWTGAPGSSFPFLQKSYMLEASLTGCRNDNDGVLDQWDRRVNFGIRFFDSSTFLSRPFTYVPPGAAGDAAHNSLEASALTAHNIGSSTAMTQALAWAGRDFRYLLSDAALGGAQSITYGGVTTDYPPQTATETCRRHIVLLLSDGDPNGVDATGTSRCDGATSGSISSGAPWNMAAYLNDGGDHMCSVAGTQSIGTYTLGFGAIGSFSPGNLQNIANSGGGTYLYASNVDALNRALEQIILSIVQRAVVFSGGGTVQRQGLFSSNLNFLASYRTANSSWAGNLKKYCMLPPLLVPANDLYGRPNYNTATNTCMFRARLCVATDLDCDLGQGANRRKVVYPNPNPTDQYTGSNSLTSDVGGAGQLLRNRLNGGAPDPTGGADRDVFTYFPSVVGGYFELDNIVNATRVATRDAEMWMPDGDTWKIINRLNGRTYDNNPVTGNWTAPVAPLVTPWPVGDPVNTNPVLLRYPEIDATPGCSQPAECTIVLPTNNGLVHFFSASNGAELAALVPGELWRPGDLTHFKIGDLERQPTLDASRRLYLDGPGQVFHEDRNGDGIIDAAAGDRAYLIFTLGRGGRVMYSMDVSRANAASTIGMGQLPPIRPLPGRDGTDYAQLRDTWGNPWLGSAHFGGERRNVAIYSSGHIPEMDRATRNVPSLVPGPTPASTIVNVPCDGAAGVAAQNGYPTSSCSINLLGPFALGNPGFDVPIGPFTMPRVGGLPTTPSAIAYRVHFSSLALNPANSFVAIQDGENRWANVVSGAGTPAPAFPLSLPLVPGGPSGPGWSRWVYGPEVAVRAVSGVGESFVAAIDEIEYMLPGTPATVEHYPTIFVTALDNYATNTNNVVGTEGWNVPANNFATSGAAFSPLLRLTRQCTGAMANCVDQTKPFANDLRHMTCPVSTEVSVVNYSDDLRLYWGDECGQIFVANNASTDRLPSEWRVRRLAHLSWNQAGVKDMSVQSSPLGTSANVRKVYRRLDIAASTCPGARVFAVYFGTGDIQRPTAKADHTALADIRYLQDNTLAEQRTSGGVNGGRDVMGVVFDTDSDTNRDITLFAGAAGGRGLFNATNVTSVSKADLNSTIIGGQPAPPRAGWFIELKADEKMLRDPLVFQNVVYYKTFQPTVLASECASGSGRDTSYAMNNCTADPLGDNASLGYSPPGINQLDREIGRAAEDIGPDPFLMTSPNAPPMVVMNGAVAGATGTGVHTRGMTSRPRIYNWRLPR